MCNRQARAQTDKIISVINMLHDFPWAATGRRVGSLCWPGGKMCPSERGFPVPAALSLRAIRRHL
jgi:hypothetical protein